MRNVQRSFATNDDLVYPKKHPAGRYSPARAICDGPPFQREIPGGMCTG